jgi:hypothetical protein
MKKEELIGKKVRGLNAEKIKGKIVQSTVINNLSEEVGVIKNYNDRLCVYEIEFSNGISVLYPAELIEQHLVEETPLDDLPIIGDGVLMEVSDNNKDWFQYNVIGKNKLGKFIAWDNENISTYLWKHARPITSKTKITRKEFEQKFEIID